MMLPQEIIRAKRDGETLSAGEIGDFIAALTSGAVSEGQAAAFAMAIYFRGMSLDERVALTQAMTRSGARLDWRDANLPGPILDKHSTGGVGDNVSLMLAPMLAACGAYVPMISGRGLGHTGGTLDKLDSIPGYKSQPDLALFKRVVRQAGCAIIGQTAELAPADRRLPKAFYMQAHEQESEYVCINHSGAGGLRNHRADGSGDGGGTGLGRKPAGVGCGRALRRPLPPIRS